jgi:hypothetical protein
MFDIPTVTWDNDYAAIWRLQFVPLFGKEEACMLNVTIISFSLLARLAGRFKNRTLSHKLSTT